MSKGVFDLVVIGGGASAVAVLAALGRRSGVRVAVVDPAPQVGLGPAYGAAEAYHLLNVPAERMGIRADAPDGFAHWLRARGLGEAPGWPFISRRVYGDYLAEVLEAEAPPWTHVIGRAVDVEPPAEDAPDDTWSVVVEDGRVLTARAVLLAIGPLSGRRLAGDLDLPAVVNDPWSHAALTLPPPPPDAPLLVVGAGLTMIDVVHRLVRQGHRGTIHVLSRRGLPPLAYGPVGARVEANIPSEAVRAGHLSRVLRAARTQARSRMARGEDWRPLVEGLRGLLGRHWPDLPAPAKQRFLRHLLPYWLIHRHRVPDEPAAVFDTLRACGRVRVLAGRVEGIAASSTGSEVRVRYRPRGAVNAEVLAAARVYNCTGPTLDTTGQEAPLVRALLRRGLVQPGPAGLGIAATRDLCVRRANGSAHPSLSVIGPLLRGELWECTAIPDIREQAVIIADRWAA